MSTDIAATPTRAAVHLVDRVAGELIDVRTASPSRLAELVDSLKDLQGTIADEIALIGAELIDRMDRTGDYTMHVADDRRRWKVTAPSKKVGTTRVDVELLRCELLVLAGCGDDDAVISDELARAALRRRVSIETTVNVGVVLADLQAKIGAGLNAIAGVPVFDVKVTTSEDVVAAGVNRLERAGHGEAVARATLAATPGPRKATVKREATA